MKKLQPTCERPNVAEGEAHNIFDAGADSRVFDQQLSLLLRILIFSVSPTRLFRCLQAAAVLDVKGQADHLC